MWSVMEKRAQSGELRVAMLTGLLAVLSAVSAHAQGPTAATEQQAAGRQIFAARCASCHGTTANGGEFAPSIVDRVPLRSDDDLVKLLHEGLPSGMPAFPDIVDQDRTNLIGFLRTLQPSQGSAMARTSVKLQGGKVLQGIALKPLRE